MADSTVVDVDLDQKKAKDDLEFQDFPHDGYGDDSKDSQTHTFTKFPPSAESDEDEPEKSELLKEDKAAKSFWTFEYYQQFFDVETYQVLYRIGGSMFPKPNSNYLKSYIRPNPDLYGPFWICTTLVFTTAIAGNLANYLQSAGKDYQWRYDFHKVTFAATAIFSYWWLVPAGIFGVLWWRGSQAGYTFLEILCVYGYSLAIYIPVSILWVIQFNWFQWILVAVGALLSGTVLVFTFWPAVKEDDKKIMWTILVVIFLLHAALAVGFKLYFFHVPTAIQPDTGSTTPTTLKVITNPTLQTKLNTHTSSRRGGSIPSHQEASKTGTSNKIKSGQGTKSDKNQADSLPVLPSKPKNTQDGGNTKAKTSSNDINKIDNTAERNKNSEDKSSLNQRTKDNLPKEKLKVRRKA